ncbi:rare lipoprotein A [Pseudomonas sp. NFACC15-1]|nr:rare lipoprotein A [Pseudomonas sp. NFACC15-1]SDB66062.1 rare lipoprotein A [Pseudomonas sp. NFACC13-1]SDZ13283.1 rare lipoprotein A [Pseudomonas sp. NFACC14]
MEPAFKSGSNLLCGSELARDSGMSVNTDVECAGLFASKLAPTFVFGNFRMKRLLGACALLSLLAGCASQSGTVDPHGYDQTGVASYYGARHHGKRTASGERFDQHGLTAAHRQLPFGTRVKITNLGNNNSVVVRINDRGPYSRGRLIDVSREAAEQLGILRSGTARVRVQALDD